MNILKCNGVTVISSKTNYASKSKSISPNSGSESSHMLSHNVDCSGPGISLNDHDTLSPVAVSKMS